MVKTACKVLGVVFLIGGLAGFFKPDLLGFHLTPIHNIIHLVTGALALYFGFSGTPEGARKFSLAFGSVYTLLAILGFLAPGVVASLLGMSGSDAHDMTPDNIFHIIVGPAFLAAGLMRDAGVPATRDRNTRR